MIVINILLTKNLELSLFHTKKPYFMEIIAIDNSLKNLMLRISKKPNSKSTQKFFPILKIDSK